MLISNLSCNWLNGTKMGVTLSGVAGDEKSVSESRSFLPKSDKTFSWKSIVSGQCSNSSDAVAGLTGCSPIPWNMTFSPGEYCPCHSRLSSGTSTLTWRVDNCWRKADCSVVNDVTLMFRTHICQSRSKTVFFFGVGDGQYCGGGLGNFITALKLGSIYLSLYLVGLGKE